jgi:SEC-C motif
MRSHLERLGAAGRLQALNRRRIMIFDMSPDSRKLFATLPNGDQTDRYECLLSVCSNPTCRCRSVYLTFVAQPPKGGTRHGQQAQWKASLDLDINGVYPEFRRTASQEDIAFSERLITEMDAHDFRLLGQLQFTVKNLITEEAKPDTIDPHFNFTEVESSATMQVYNDILPFGDRLLITIDGVEHILLDQHCVRTGCDCTETYIELAPILPDGNQGEHVGTILLDYARRRWQSAPDDDPPCDLPALRQRIENAIPDFYTQLSRRHSKLQAIYGHCRKRHLATMRETKMTLPKNVGRNDLCPCGSGKKYKKCCIA